MENRPVNLTIPLIGSCVLILFYALFKQEAFEWVVLIIPFSIASHIISLKSNLGNLVHMGGATLIGLTIFLSFPIYICLTLFTLLGLKFNSNYAPASIQPRLLIDRNLSPFIFVSLAVVKFVLFSMHLDYSHYEHLLSNPSLITFLMLFLTIGYFEQILIESKRNYDTLKSTVATKEKNWTNNVMTLLSHNIRTPIASLGNRVDIIKLKKNAGIEISDDDIEGLIEDRERVNSIVHSLLSKSSRNIISSKDTSESSISEALNDYVDRVKILKPEGIDFNLSSNDIIALDLALESIISNSEKYGASQIQIALDTHDNEVSITISDDGEGMDDVTLERYGTPFNSSKSKNGGSGLGVYFALQLVKEAGWQWSVDSEHGKGTTVTIRIPKILLVL